MTRPANTLAAGAAFAACALFGASASAQTAKPETHSEIRIVRDGGDVQVIRDGRTVVMTHAGRRADRAEHLRAVLQLKPNQEAALAAYVQALAPPKPEATTFTDGDGAKTTPERLAAEEKLLGEHVAMMRAHIEATRRFYDQLDPAQKRAFDELHEGPTMMLHRTRFEGPMPPMPPVPPVPPPGL
jgi:hypothetical protein